MIILPAIIPESVEDLESRLLQIKSFVKNVQIDICDGRLTPSASWPFINEYGEMEEMVKQERGLPFWEHFDFEIDLMVLNPAKEYERWIDIGATRLIFHYKESEVEILKEIMQKTKERGVEVGLALHLSDSIEAIEYFKDLVDSVQCMGIEKIGFQGQLFDERVLEMVKNIKNQYPNLVVSVDGGVNVDTAPLLIKAGVDRLVIGSAIFGSLDIAETIGYFNSLS